MTNIPPLYSKYLGCHPRDRLSTPRVIKRAARSSPCIRFIAFPPQRTRRRGTNRRLSPEKLKVRTRLGSTQVIEQDIRCLQRSPDRSEHKASLALGATQWPAPDTPPDRTHRPTSAALLTLYGPAVAIVRIHKWSRLLLSPSALPLEQQVQGYDS